MVKFILIVPEGVVKFHKKNLPRDCIKKNGHCIKNCSKLFLIYHHICEFCESGVTCTSPEF